MRKILLLIPLFALSLALPVACAGSYHMDISGSGNIGFYFISSDDSGTILQGYYGDGTVDYESTYNDGTLETDIESTGPGIFGTILAPANSWTIDETYSKDGSPPTNYIDDGPTPEMFLHSWTSSFSNMGYYSVN